MATVGQSLTAPEAGWRRFDDTDQNIVYEGTWISGSQGGGYNLTTHDTLTKGSKTSFNFSGTRIRVIGYSSDNRSSSVSISIDGSQPVIFSAYNATTIAQCLLYERLDLENTTHNVVITLTGENYYSLDAVDIDETGELKPYNPISGLTLTATAGDSRVTLSWTAVDGATGYNVKRSTTAGGPYTTIAPSVSGPSYVDTAVTNGTTYYYVVTAITASGESSNSNEASATPQAVVTPPSTGNILRVTVIDSSDHDYQLSSSEIDGFVNWFMKHTSTDNAGYLLTKKTGTQNSKEYLAFDKIISFEVIPVA